MKSIFLWEGVIPAGVLMLLCGSLLLDLFGVVVGVLALNNSVAICALNRLFDTFFVLFSLWVDFPYRFAFFVLSLPFFALFCGVFDCWWQYVVSGILLRSLYILSPSLDVTHE
jgi:hypothetical protein